MFHVKHNKRKIIMENTKMSTLVPNGKIVEGYGNVRTAVEMPNLFKTKDDGTLSKVPDKYITDKLKAQVSDKINKALDVDGGFYSQNGTTFDSNIVIESRNAEGEVVYFRPVVEVKFSELKKPKNGAKNKKPTNSTSESIDKIFV